MPSTGSGSLHVNGTPASGPAALAAIDRRRLLARRLEARQHDRVEVAVALLDPRQVLVQHLDRAALARGDGGGDLAGAHHSVGHTLRPMERIAKGYREFADARRSGRSPLYAELAAGVAGDREILAWLDGLPVGKRQPNLLFAGYRALAGTPAGWPEFRTVLGERRDEIEALMLERRTQTNEPARCALMLPLLAALPQPLALLEVGASAGLCLLPDHYGYDYDGHRLGNGSPTLRCTPEGPVPLPDALPEIVWRAGLDLEPIDIDDPERVRWLELLIWPGEEYRLETSCSARSTSRAPSGRGSSRAT